MLLRAAEATSLRLFCQMGSKLFFAAAAYIRDANLPAKRNALKDLICYEGKSFKICLP
jgi:hypothetical protein